MTASISGASPLTSNGAAGPGKVYSAFVVVGLLALFIPSYQDFLFGSWSSYSRGHEPVVLAVAAWLIWRQREQLASVPPSTPASSLCLLVLGLLIYLLGRTQQLLRVELLATTVILVSTLASFKGWRAVRCIWFAVVLMLFCIPLPYSWVITLTAPLQAAVSVVAATLLAWAGYPAGHAGVVLTVGQYQLLVAEACAGLHTMFTLEAMGLLYLHLANHQSWLRNALLTVLVIPLSFCANVVRVVTLCLVTYHLGDSAGQGFAHRFAGLLLFAIALALMGSVDRLLGIALRSDDDLRRQKVS